MKNYFTYLFLAAGISLCAQKQFTNNGNFKIHNGGAVTVYGDFVNNGSFTDEGQKVTLGGTSLQNIGGTSATTFSNLILNNPVGSTLTTNQNLKGMLTISQGTFATTGKVFTLLSDANNTGRIAPITGDFSGNITMQRYLGTGPTDWRQLASPVTGATIADWQDDFTTTGFPGSSYPSFGWVSVYTYNEASLGSSAYGYATPTSASNPLTPGKGFFTYVGPTPVTVDVTGPPAKFNQTFTVSYTQSAGAAEDGWALIGNPYACPIDWTSGAWSKTNINDALYIWNPELQQYASYVSGVSTNGGSPIIASSQSFWIQTNAASPALSCTEYIKHTGTDASFIRQMNPFLANLKLNFKGNNYTDETVLRFGTTATGKFDKQHDARKMFTSTAGVPSISTLDSTSSDMSVNSLPVFDNGIKIPVKTLVSPGYSGNYTISRDSISSIPEGYCVMLEDLATGNMINLNTNFSYSFYISDTTAAPRFLIHMRAAHVVNTFAANCNGSSTGKVVAEGKGTGPWNYIWMDGANTVIQSTNGAMGKDSIVNVAAGNYFVYIISANNMCGSNVTTVTVTQPEPVLAGFHINNPVVEVNTGSVNILNTSYNATSFQWNFDDGSPVLTTSAIPAHVYNSVGQHTITLIATNGACSNAITKTVTVTNSIVQGVEEVTNEGGLSVYPNPGNGLFNFDISGPVPQGSVVEVYDAAGRKIHSAEVMGEKTELDLRSGAKGVYFYKLSLGAEKMMSGKLIIK
ncbi:MAG: hemagluttinin repeat-containing protein [Bacteroidetes bacterium]|jgi:PKD repeat protein|nr:hemagluttinin repeat-containing protein [Bacteroidota bacterium]